MATYWHKTDSKRLEHTLNDIKKGKTNVSIVKASAIVPEQGAFVILKNKKDAEKVFLCETLIIYGSEKSEGYEQHIEQPFPQAVFITAESKTADIEKKLVSGVHGAKECHFVVDESV